MIASCNSVLFVFLRTEVEVRVSISVVLGVALEFLKITSRTGCHVREDHTGRYEFIAEDGPRETDSIVAAAAGASRLWSLVSRPRSVMLSVLETR